MSDVVKVTCNVTVKSPTVTSNTHQVNYYFTSAENALKSLCRWNDDMSSPVQLECVPLAFEYVSSSHVQHHYLIETTGYYLAPTRKIDP